MSGASYALIEDAIAQQWPDIQSRPALLVVMNEVMDNYNQPKDMLLGWCLESTKELYRKLVSIGDFANALRALKEYRAIIEKKETSISDLLKNG